MTMVVDGRALAEKIHEKLREETEALKTSGTTPHIAIVTFKTSEAAWASYVGQKIKLAQNLGAKASLTELQTDSKEEFKETMKRLNSNPNIHGIIVQRPFPETFDKQMVIESVVPEKDIDGFRKDSNFEYPIWRAVEYIVRHAARLDGASSLDMWLKGKNVVVVGKGETGGLPMIEGMRGLGVKPQIVDSKTENREEILKKADLIICAAGRSGVVRPEEIKKGVVLIGIGMHREEDGKLHGDYEAQEIEQIASYYTPIPGGVGPVNVAFLFMNLLNAAKQQA